jgi:4-amino-4-deoxy-L-arabinose transferase-like glycosyltransferase
MDEHRLTALVALLWLRYWEPEKLRMKIYIIAFAIIFAVLILLRFLESSPVRSWKMVFLIGIPLSLFFGYYYNHALPEKASAVPQAAKASNYRQELERTCRRIAGVQNASIEGNTVQMDFAEDKPIAEFKRIAKETGGTASYFLKTNNNSIKITVHISVKGRDRYEMNYESNRGVTDEREL